MAHDTLSEDPTKDAEIGLTYGGLTLYVSAYGASLRGFVQDVGSDSKAEVVTRYEGASHKVGGQGDVLIPFPGRVKGGSYTFNGSSYQMAITDHEGPNAIHGFLRARVWEIVQQDLESVTFSTKLSGEVGYPFALQAEVKYEVSQTGMVCSYKVTNVGTATAPVAAGFHPYFTVGTDLIDDSLLSVPFDSVLEFDSGLIPTGRIFEVAEAGLDFRQPTRIGNTKFNSCFLRPIRSDDGKVRIGLYAPDGSRSLAVWLGSSVDYVVLYSGDPLPTEHRRKSLAIEPMSCGSDAFNHPEWGLVAVKPGESLTGQWGVEVD